MRGFAWAAHCDVALDHRGVVHGPALAHGVRSSDEGARVVDAHDVAEAALAELEGRAANGAAHVERQGRRALARKVFQRIAVALHEDGAALGKVDGALQAVFWPLWAVIGRADKHAR